MHHQFITPFFDYQIKNGVIFKAKINNQNLFGLNKNYKAWRLWTTKNVDVEKTTSSEVS